MTPPLDANRSKPQTVSSLRAGYVNVLGGKYPWPIPGSSRRNGIKLSATCSSAPGPPFFVPCSTTCPSSRVAQRSWSTPCASLFLDLFPSPNLHGFRHINSSVAFLRGFGRAWSNLRPRSQKLTGSRGLVEAERFPETRRCTTCTDSCPICSLVSMFQ